MVHGVKSVTVSSQKKTTFEKCYKIRGEKVWVKRICYIRSPFIGISLNGVFGNVTSLQKS